MTSCVGKLVRHSPEQVAVLPRRVWQYGDWPKAHPCDARWINYGQAADDIDLFPWLHEYQQGGYEVCIVGSSLDACKVCAEAYESGFQPALVFLEDKVPEADKELTMKTVALLKARRFKTGILNCGFEVVITTSSEVRLKLHDDGHVSDVRLESQVQRYDVRGRPIEYEWRGPAIVIGNVIEADMLEGELVGDDRLALFEQRNKRETERVIRPEFWERRNDPHCRNFATPTYGFVLPIMTFTALQSSLVFTIVRFHRNPYFLFMRAAVDIFHRLVLCNAVVICDTNFYGIDLPTGWVTPYTVMIIAVYQLASMALCLLEWDNRLYMGDFAITLLGVSQIQHLLQICIILFSNVKFCIWPFLVGYFGIIGTAGSWFLCMPTLLFYQLLLGIDGVAASIFLSVTLPLCETTLIKSLAVVFNLVAKKRREDPFKVPGDQKMGLSFCAACTHCFFETARLASLVCGAVGAEDVSFLMNIGVSLVTSAVINTSFRTGLMANLLVKVPGRLGHALIPNGLWCLHNNVKFSMGWCRFFAISGLFLCRGLIHGQWKVDNWLVVEGREGVWCWSGVVLATVLLAFIAEVVEDIIVFCVCHSNVPLIKSVVYKEVMMKRLSNPVTASRLNVVHYLLPPPAASGAMTRHSRHSVIADKFVLSPNLTGLRPIPIVHLTAIGIANNVLLYGAISLGVGSANMFGFCRPLSFREDDFGMFLRNMGLWSFDCQDL